MFFEVWNISCHQKLSKSKNIKPPDCNKRRHHDALRGQTVFRLLSALIVRRPAGQRSQPPDDTLSPPLGLLLRPRPHQDQDQGLPPLWG